MESKYIYLGKREGIYLVRNEVSLENALVDRGISNPSLITMGIPPNPATQN